MDWRADLKMSTKIIEIIFIISENREFTSLYIKSINCVEGTLKRKLLQEPISENKIKNGKTFFLERGVAHTQN